MRIHKYTRHRVGILFRSPKNETGGRRINAQRYTQSERKYIFKNNAPHSCIYNLMLNLLLFYFQGGEIT